MNILTGFDSSRYYLGKLCPRLHDYNESGKSLRTKSSRNCKQCTLIMSAKSKKRKKQEGLDLSEYRQARFWNLTKKVNDCIEWQGAIGVGGYGLFSANFSIKTHRYSYILSNGKIEDGLCVCHKCDNPKCVNPDHLFLGTNKDNMEDRNKKGRTSKGENHYFSKFKEKDILYIRSLYDQGKTLKDISDITGFKYITIRDIAYKYSWKHV